MKLIYSHPNFSQVALVRSLLERESVPSIIRNEHLSMLVGKLAPQDVAPELWVADEDAFLAQSIITQFQAEPSLELASWVCPRCGAENEANMGLCWNCDYQIDGPESQ